MEIFDLALAYVWEYDEDFINLTEQMLQDSGISTFRISYHNIFEVTKKIEEKKLYFNFYLDRASDVEEDFVPLANVLSRKKTTIFNPYKNVSHAADKASMHLEFITAGLNVPYSIIIPPHSEKEEIYISLDDLAILGRPFIIKPCNTTGGGIGVVTGAETLKEVFEERMSNYNDKYLIQQKIYPTILDGKRSWFRCFRAFGKTVLSWWDDQTHLYSEMTEDEIKIFNLKKLFSVTKTIAEITQLDFFSTEIVLTSENKFVVVDYVNELCDMRLKSKHTDGVPDRIVNQIINSLREKILRLKRSS